MLKGIVWKGYPLCLRLRHPECGRTLGNPHNCTNLKIKSTQQVLVVIQQNKACDGRAVLTMAVTR